jgi:hypothetical protein
VFQEAFNKLVVSAPPQNLRRDLSWILAAHQF